MWNSAQDSDLAHFFGGKFDLFEEKSSLAKQILWQTRFIELFSHGHVT